LGFAPTGEYLSVCGLVNIAAGFRRRRTLVPLKLDSGFLIDGGQHSDDPDRALTGNQRDRKEKTGRKGFSLFLSPSVVSLHLF